MNATRQAHANAQAQEQAASAGQAQLQAASYFRLNYSIPFPTKSFPLNHSILHQLIQSAHLQCDLFRSFTM